MAFSCFNDCIGFWAFHRSLSVPNVLDDEISASPVKAQCKVCFPPDQLVLICKFLKEQNITHR